MATQAGLLDPARLAAVRATSLLDTAAEPGFDRLTGLAATLLSAPLAFVTLVDDRRSFWKSCLGTGLPDDDLPARQNTVEESFCRYVVVSREPLIVGDTRLNELTRDNPSIEAMGVLAWAGFPVFSPDGHVLGSFCVVDTVTRDWSDRDVEVLRVLSQSAAAEFAGRVALAQARAAERDARELALALQESLLPALPPSVPGLDVAARYRPAGTGSLVVGDFLDVFPLGSGNGWAAVIGDVSGKGVEAAKVAALARHTVRGAAMAGSNRAACCACSTTRCSRRARRRPAASRASSPRPTCTCT
jgi:phosphoserine phosphatase RsbU/P